MKAAIALLANYKAQNFVRRIVFELEKDYQIDFMASLLPAHISLKQPFSFESMHILENYFDGLAQRIAPFQIELRQVYYTEWEGYGILGINVRETDILRGLHQQLNRELREILSDPSAPHDGDAYRFHMTIELGIIGKQSPYQLYFERLEDKSVNQVFLAEEIALFYYTGENHLSYICYKILPLCGENKED